MSLFKTIISKIFGKDSTPDIPASIPQAPAPGAYSGAALGKASSTPITHPAPAPDHNVSSVDVGAVLEGMAAKNPEKLDWKHSIVDLMKLLDMDSSLASRKELAAELDYPGDMGDSANMNIWLHRQVLKKLAENGGKVPQELLS